MFFTASSVRVIGHKLHRLRGMTSDWDHQSELLILRGTTGSTMNINKRPSTRNADGSMIDLLHLIRVSNVVTVLIHLPDVIGTVDGWTVALALARRLFSIMKLNYPQVFH